MSDNGAAAEDFIITQGPFIQEEKLLEEYAMKWEKSKPYILLW
jgi:hypothetical protein